MHVVAENPADRLPGRYPEADRVEPDVLAPRASAHLDLRGAGGPQRGGRGKPGECRPADRQESAPRNHDYYFSAAACCGETYQTTTW